MVLGLTVDVPGDAPDRRVGRLSQGGLAHRVFEERAVGGGERFDGDKEVGAGGEPGRTVRGEPPARDDVGDMWVVLELPAPGMEAPGEPREVSADEALVV